MYRNTLHFFAAGLLLFGGLFIVWLTIGHMKSAVDHGSSPGAIAAYLVVAWPGFTMLVTGALLGAIAEITGELARIRDAVEGQAARVDA